MVGRRLPAGRVLQVRVRHQLSALVDAASAVPERTEAGVHDMRVASRRLAAALAMFRPVVRGPEGGSLRDELRWLARSLGAARDRDVVRERLHLLARTHLDDGALGDEVVARLPSSGQASPADALPPVDVLASARYGTLLAGLEDVADHPPWTAESDPAAGPFLRHRLRKERDHLDSKVSVVLAAGPGAVAAERLHDVRKAAKRLRYGLETAELLWPRKAKMLREHLHRLTDILGEHQDTVITREVLRDLTARADGQDGTTPLAWGRLHDIEVTRAAELETAFGREWIDAADLRSRWP